MIRIRNKQGEIIPEENVAFVEICDAEDNVACAIYEDGNKQIHFITQDSPAHARYANIMQVNFSEIIELPAILQE